MTKITWKTEEDQKHADSVLFTVLFCVVYVICGVVALAAYFDVLVK